MTIRYLYKKYIMAKEIIRLTESDLHNMIMESVKNILKESPYTDVFGRRWSRGGRIPRDGMTGGEWYGEERSGKYNIDVFELVQNLSEDSYVPGIQEELEKIGSELYFTVTCWYGADHSVGIKEGYDNIQVDTNPAVQAIMSCNALSDDQKQEIENIFNNLADDIESQGDEFAKVKGI